MSKITSAAAVMIMGMFMVGIFAAPVNALIATAPTWEVDDPWAMGKEVDLGADLTDYIDNNSDLNDLLMYSNMTIDDLNIDSMASAYVIFTVVSETDTTYTLTAKMAVKLATQANMKITGMLPAAGTYDADQNLWFGSDVPKETKIISAELTEKLGIVIGATAIVDKSSYAVNKIDWTLKCAMVLEAKAKNIPQINSTENQQIVSYKDYDLGMSLVAGANLSMLFTPALDLYQFPFSTNDAWYTNNSMVTVTGDISGSFNAHGLTAEQEEQIFTGDLKNATGSTKFPIEFDHLTSPDGEITDGNFGPYYGNITTMEMECLSGDNETINGVDLDVFNIQIDGGAQMLYASGFKVLGLSANIDSLPMDLPSEVSSIMAMMGNQDIAMDPVPVDTATAKIASIETYTDSVASQAGANGASSSLADFFLKAPFTGIIMAVLAAVIITALLAIGLKSRKH